MAEDLPWLRSQAAATRGIVRTVDYEMPFTAQSGECGSCSPASSWLIHINDLRCGRKRLGFSVIPVLVLMTVCDSRTWLRLDFNGVDFNGERNVANEEGVLCNH